MRPISKRVKKILQADPFMEQCIVCGSHIVEWNHVFTYAGKQIDEPFNIVPMCKKHHDQSTPHKNTYKEKVRDQAELAALTRMQIEDVAKYPKRDWSQLAYYLNKKYENTDTSRGES
jgi:hypothetical protein